MATLVAKALASAFLAGDWTPAGMVDRGAQVLGRSPDWLPRLVKSVLRAYAIAPHDARDDLATFLESQSAFRRGRQEQPRLRVQQWLIDEPSMGVQRWPVPPLATPIDLARWLKLTEDASCIGRLEWFADRAGFERFVEQEKLLHYRYKWIAKRSGGHRLLEVPKPKLRALQRKIAKEILYSIPPHEASLGFFPGGSVVSFASVHVGRAVVLRCDVESFFPSIRAARVFGIFRSAGYPEQIARLLTGLCTNRVARTVLARAPGRVAPRTLEQVAAITSGALWCDQKRLEGPHLPQGAPTSPALANLCAYRLDVRLSAAAQRVGARYSRYADDLAFSGDATFARQAERFQILVGAIAIDEGFRLNFRKTRIMGRHTRQHLAGMVVNERPNVARAQYDTLKAILHNCVHQGPASQNRDGHSDFRAYLQGRVAWIRQVHAARGARLQALFDAVDWSNESALRES